MFIEWLLAANLIASAPIEIADEADLPLLSADLVDRKTAKIRLPNGLEAYLISDPKTDQAGAAVAVGVGSWSDPAEYPGMAHFCEHMLFMGSKKFPSESEFRALSADYNGQNNAFTAADRTVYMFASNEEGFSPILERFSRFFIDPLFDPSAISRELHAVDQEHSKNIEHDGWRENMVFKETGNPNHPNRQYDCGNAETLGHIPQQALKDWHQKYYGADKMRIVLYSSKSIEQLKELALFFSEVPSKSTPVVIEGELSSEQQRGHVTVLKPIKDRRTLTLAWELPQELSRDSSKPAQMIAYALSRAQENSLFQTLKKEGLITKGYAYTEGPSEPNHRFFQISLELTDQGLAEMNTAILRCFEALNGLKASGLPYYLFDEMNQVAKLDYQFQARQDAFQYIMSIGRDILNESLATYPREELLASDYSPYSIRQVFKALNPAECMVTLLANTGEPATHRERWLGAEYSIQEISSSSLVAWHDAQANPHIQLANPNPFLPSRLTIAEKSGTKAPLCIAQDDAGIAYYDRLSQFQTPKSAMTLHLCSPLLTPTSHSAAIGTLFLYDLQDRLDSTLGAASQAGFDLSLTLEQCRLNLSLLGFSDKSSLLLQEILKEMVHNPSNLAQFEITKKRLMRDCANRSKDLICIQAIELAKSLIEPDRFTKQDILEALDQISYKEFSEFRKNLFKEAYAKAFFTGNLSLKDAESAWLDVRHLLGNAPFPKDKHSVPQVLIFGDTPLAIYENKEILGNAAILVLQDQVSDFTQRASHDILSAVLHENFFDTLRTKQKTGYIAQSDTLEIQNYRFQRFLVQSSSHQSEDLLSRFELFCETMVQDLPELVSEERFSTLKQGIADSLQKYERGLDEKSELLDTLAFEKEADFNWVQKRLQGFSDLTYEGFLDQADQLLSRNNHKRLAILMDGKVQEPFTYKTISRSEFSGEYLSRPQVAQNE